MINPVNDPIKFILFLFIPFITIFLYFLKSNKFFIDNFSKVINFNILLDDTKELKKNYELNFFTFIIILVLILEFLSLNFLKFQNNLDFFHEGMWLSASNNLKLSGELWLSSYIVRGLFADFFPFYLWEYFGKETIGIVRFFELFIFFLNKILILFIARKLSLFTRFSKNNLILFFLILSFALISLQGYVNPIFLIRSFLYLIFIIIFLNFIDNYNNIFYILILGLFSSISFFWYVDIAIYINVILLILLIYFIIKFEFKKSIYLLLAMTTSWLFIILSLPKNEVYQFIDNLNLILSTLGWIHNLNYPSPFISLDARSGKSSILFLITGYLMINSINDLKKNNIIFIFSIIFLFIASLLYFNYGLGRSDGGHIRVATSLLFIPFFSISLFYIFKLFQDYNMEKLFIFKYLNIFVLVLFSVSTIFINKKYEDKQISNIFNFKPSIQKMINYNNEKYINNDYKKFINYYQNLIKYDDCAMIFTNETALYYLLNKKSCSKYYFMWIASPKIIQKKLIVDLKVKNPSYILYSSESDLFYESDKKLKKVNKFILSNYIFYEKFDKWIIYKKKDNEKN